MKRSAIAFLLAGCIIACAAGQDAPDRQQPSEPLNLTCSVYDLRGEAPQTPSAMHEMTVMATTPAERSGTPSTISGLSDTRSTTPARRSTNSQPRATSRRW